MSPQDSATLTRKMYQWFNENQIEPIVECAAENAEVTLVPFGQTLRGAEGFRQFLTGFKRGVPDIRIDLTNQVAGGDQVVNEFIVRGTHTGPLATPAGDLPPTGRSIEYPVCEVWSFRDGKMCSIRNYFDAATLMRQLGAMS